MFLPAESHGQRTLAGYSPWVSQRRTGLSTHTEPPLARCLGESTEQAPCRSALHREQGQKSNFIDFSGEGFIFSFTIHHATLPHLPETYSLGSHTVLPFWVLIGWYRASPFILDDFCWPLNSSKNKAFLAFCHRHGDCISYFDYFSSSPQKCHLLTPKIFLSCLLGAWNCGGSSGFKRKHDRCS